MLQQRESFRFNYPRALKDPRCSRVKRFDVIILKNYRAERVEYKVTYVSKVRMTEKQKERGGDSTLIDKPLCNHRATLQHCHVLERMHA
jgi:hypothetical protein